MTTRLTLLPLVLTVVGCDAGSVGRVGEDGRTAEEIAREILDEYGTSERDGGFGLSGDAALARSLTLFGHPWTVEDVARNREEAWRLDRDLTVKWTRGYLAELEGATPPAASRYIFGATLEEEIAGARNQIGYITNSVERKRQLSLPDTERLEELRGYLAKLRGPSPPPYPYLWSGAGQTLGGEIAAVEAKIEGMERLPHTARGEARGSPDGSHSACSSAS